MTVTGESGVAMERRLRQAVANNPTDFNAVLALGRSLALAGQRVEAQSSLEKALVIKPGNSLATLELARLMLQQDEYSRAERLFRSVLAGDPGHIEATLGLAELELSRGNPDRAQANCRQALGFHPADGALWHRLVSLRTWKSNDPEVAELGEVCDAALQSGEPDIMLAYARAKVLDDIGDYRAAFTCYQRANALQASRLDFSPVQWRDFFQRHQKWQAQSRMAALGEAAVSGAKPIFVLGLPRSGTSLVEQILASHPDITGAGEVEFTRLIVDTCVAATARPFPEGIDACDPADLHGAALEYCARLRECVPDKDAATQRVVDKLPHNFLRIGVLATLFPGASFVLCERDARDVCFSIYRQYFSDSHAYACDLGELGRYYRGYQDLVRFWDQEFPGRLFHLSYEALVEDPQTTLRDLLSHLGVGYDPACLSFHQNSRYVATPSAAQVRKPLYSTALDHWRHYEPYLEPLLQALAGEPG